MSPAQPRPETRTVIVLATTLFLSYAYFYQAGGWNQNSRFDLVRAIVEQGTLRIDAYHHNTRDKAIARGHYYSDKAPGLALAGVPVAAAVMPLLGDSSGPSYVVWLSYWLTVALAALPTAAGATLLYRVARRFGADEPGAYVAALVFGLATPAWAYATLLFGHALATCLLIAAFAASMRLGDDKGRRRDVLVAGGLGFAAGWAAITEYTTAIPALLIAGLAVTQIWSGGWSRRVRVAAAITGAALVPLAALALYNQAAFGSVFELGYTHVEGFGAMRQGVMGVAYPTVQALRGILIGVIAACFSTRRCCLPVWSASGSCSAASMRIPAGSRSRSSSITCCSTAPMRTGMAGFRTVRVTWRLRCRFSACHSRSCGRARVPGGAFRWGVSLSCRSPSHSSRYRQQHSHLSGSAVHSQSCCGPRFATAIFP